MKAKKGQTMVETALLCLMAVLACIAGVYFFNDAIAEFFKGEDPSNKTFATGQTTGGTKPSSGYNRTSLDPLD